MKQLFLSALFILSAYKAHAVAIETDNPKIPASFQLVSRGNSGNNSICNYFDTNGNLRLRIVIVDYENDCRVDTYNSFGAGIGSENFNPATCSGIQQALSTVGPKTPVTVSIDRATTRILTIKSTVDYLSSTTTPPNEG